MADNTHLLLRTNLKQLKLPTMGAEFEKLAREAADANEAYEQYLLRLTELEVATRSANAVQTRIRNAGFPLLKDFDTFDFSVVPSLNKPKVLELARGEWINERSNACLIGAPGTGKTHVAIALALAACRQGKRVRFVTAGALVTQLEEAQKRYTLDRLLGQLDRLDLLVCDELGYLSFSRGGAELLFQVFADRYERKSLLVTSNLAFSEWNQVFQGERMTAALLDRLTHRCHIFEMNGESYRFRESMKTKKSRKAEPEKAEPTRGTGASPLGALPPDPQDFQGMNSGDHREGRKKRLRRHGWTRGAEYLVVHRRPDYPSAGCVPAEPASVSPGDGKVTSKPEVKQVQPPRILVQPVYP